MTHQLVLLNKGTATESASIRSLPRVDTLVLDAVVFTFKAPATIHTLVRPERPFIQRSCMVVEGGHQPLEQSREPLSMSPSATCTPHYPNPPLHSLTLHCTTPLWHAIKRPLRVVVGLQLVVGR